jgi:hypothetical protein
MGKYCLAMSISIDECSGHSETWHLIGYMLKVK